MNPRTSKRISMAMKRRKIKTKAQAKTKTKTIKTMRTMKNRINKNKNKNKNILMRAGSPTVQMLPYRVFMQTHDDTTIFPSETTGVGENTVHSIMLSANSLIVGSDLFTRLKRNLMDRLMDLMEYIEDEVLPETEVRIFVAKPIEGRMPTREEANVPANREVLYTGRINDVLHLDVDFFQRLIPNSRMVVELLSA